MEGHVALARLISVYTLTSFINFTHVVPLINSIFYYRLTAHCAKTHNFLGMLVVHLSTGNGKG
jgi:hypothetical protein